MMNGERTVTDLANELGALPSAPALPAHALLEEVRDLVARYGR